MNYNTVNIYSPVNPNASILIIYTGGTFGMVKDEDGVLTPFNFEKIMEHLPELDSLNLKLTVTSFPQPIDSSNTIPTHWQHLAYLIEKNYSQYDGFVILHGTDTMAYSASAMSFVLNDLNKPVIFTGAQIPIGSIRSDARENLITAIEIASQNDKDHPQVSEVCIYFNYYLLRANRSQKINNSTFSAFHSENYPALAQSGIAIDYNKQALRKWRNVELKIRDKFDENVAVLKIFPGIKRPTVQAILNIVGLKGLILETYGSGNTMQDDWFVETLSSAISRGILILNVSQCMGGKVEQGKYQTSKELNKIGVISGNDMTIETAIVKLMWILGNFPNRDQAIDMLTVPLEGEMTI